MTELAPLGEPRAGEGFCQLILLVAQGCCHRAGNKGNVCFMSGHSPVRTQAAGGWKQPRQSTEGTGKVGRCGSWRMRGGKED